MKKIKEKIKKNSGKASVLGLIVLSIFAALKGILPSMDLNNSDSLIENSKTVEVNEKKEVNEEKKDEKINIEELDELIKENQAEEETKNPIIHIDGKEVFLNKKLVINPEELPAELSKLSKYNRKVVLHSAKAKMVTYKHIIEILEKNEFVIIEED